MVTQRTYILPGRLIVVLIVVILVPLVIATAVTQPEKTLPVGDSDVEQPQLRKEANGSRPVQMSTWTVPVSTAVAAASHHATGGSAPLKSPPAPLRIGSSG